LSILLVDMIDVSVRISGRAARARRP